MSEGFTEDQIDNARFTPEEEKRYRNGGLTLAELGDSICADHPDKDCGEIKRELEKWARQTDDTGNTLYGGPDENGNNVYTDDEQDKATDYVFSD